ncbi:hypothetical protein GQ472_01570 [archaeon]|nr:hypothetical protein [archaeon]
MLNTDGLLLTVIGILVLSIIIGYLLMYWHYNKLESTPDCDYCVHCRKDMMCSKKNVGVDHVIIKDVIDNGCKDYEYRKGDMSA